MHSVEKIADDRLQQLQKFLLQHHLMDLVELHGFLTAVVSAPGLMPPSQWLQHIGLSNKANTLEEMQTILGIVMSFYNNICTGLSDGNFSIEAFFDSANIADSITEKKKWAKGYITAVRLDDEWNINEIQNDFLYVSLLANTTQELKIDGDTINAEELASAASEYLSKAAVNINEHWRKKRVAMMQKTRAAQRQSAEPKTGRNDPCSCGSGKKFKKCCMH